MRPEPWGISAVTHIAYMEQAVWESSLQRSFEIPVMHHACREVVAQDDNALPLANRDQRFLFLL